MDQSIRNKLRNVVTQCRKLLEEAVSQVLQGQFGISASGRKDEVHVEDESSLKLSAEDQGCRRDLVAHLGHIQALGYKAKDALAQLVREIAFTHLNRLCAYKMMEAREVWVGGQRFREAVSRGMKSQGFQFFLADHADDKTLFDAGHQDVAYRHFLGWLGALLSEEIGVLFSPTDPANRLFPPQRVLDVVLDLLNGDELAGIWDQDETIGWVYQYFTPKELRDQVRKESAAPRNSYELAFRNQFFTPRYVVEFLTDNTLGRIWYEMRRGDTKLKDQCRYLVRRPNEVFLAEGQSPPEAMQNQEEMSQEELLKQPAHLPHRPKKDPRELRILDPACGSGHFLLYCFALLLTIYEEAYADPNLGPKLKEDYPTLDTLRRDVPRLILAHNLHGIDIDLRASQIAALALWLRCQRAYREIGLKQDRPTITKSNIVFAEPMPGENEMLKEFVSQLQPKLLGHLVEVVFDKMKLAGEAGSLLKIEEELRDAIAHAKKQWAAEHEPGMDRKGRLLLFSRAEMERLANQTPQPQLFDFSEITDEQFWNEAETQVLVALRSYAAHAANGGKLRRQLFAEDAAQGFAFIDLCQKDFDVALMNPPFGESSKPAKDIIEKQYPRTKNDLYAAFVERGLNRLHPSGLLGAITSRTGFFLPSFEKWRKEVLLDKTRLTIFADLGAGVLDSAMVETAAYCFEARRGVVKTPFFRLLHVEEKRERLETVINDVQHSSANGNCYIADPLSFEQVPGSPFAYWVSERIRNLFRDLPAFDKESEGRATRCGLGTTDNFRFLRLNWEVLVAERTINWLPYYDGGVYSPVYDLFPLVVWWKANGEDIKAFISSKFGSASRKVQGEEYYKKPGFVFPRRTKGLCPKVMAAGGIFSNAGQAGFVPKEELLAAIGFLTSDICSLLISLSQGRTGDAAQFEVGLIKRLPWVQIDSQELASELSFRTRAICDAKRRSFQGNEVSHDFVLPHGVTAHGGSLHEKISNAQSSLNKDLQEISERLDEINLLVLNAYNIAREDRLALIECSEEAIGSGSGVDSEEEFKESPDTQGPEHFVKGIVSYAFGCVFARWDVRFATGERSAPKLLDPFDPVPVCSPGMLQGSNRMPLLETPEGYPLHIKGDGILPDDPDHADDIVCRVREVLEVIWKGRAEPIEKECCEILGIKELRDHFRKLGKGSFWDDHVSRYSKSRRKAPIYWLLQSSKKNYALWLYYPRLDKDILFKARQNYVEPKVRLEQSRLDSLRSQKTALGTATKGAKIDKDIERQEALLGELKDFAEKLERAAKLTFGNPERLDSAVVYDPDLNDGVVLTIAPLWELVPWKEAKNYWEELLEGKYEWSSMGKLLRKKGLVS